MDIEKLMAHISIIPDYRQPWKIEYKLSDILLLTICAVISGAEGWEDIQDFGDTHLDFLKQYGDFEHGIPVHDTIARVVSCIILRNFMNALLTGCVIAIALKMVVLLLSMEKRFVVLMIKAVGAGQYMLSVHFPHRVVSSLGN